MNTPIMPTPADVLAALHEVIDSELGYNIVDLGFIYSLEVVDGRVDIAMTMTTPGCPAADYILGGVRERCLRIPGVTDVDVTLVWEPPWSPARMHSAARTYFDITEDG
ncbi:MAG: metal-sulfur cluster assembly factor [Acidiferrobacteraceae bacterium]